MNLALNFIQHIGIPVTDLSLSEEFYRKLGFENVMSSTFLHNGEEGKVAMMKKGEMIIELYQMPAAALTEIKNRGNGHIDHIAFDVPDIVEAFKILSENGYNIIEPAPVFLPFWEKGCRYFNITGPGGERIEFNQVLT